MMDIRRSIIFVGLAIVSYMLVLAWNDDYGQVTSQSVAPTSSAPNNNALAIEPSNELSNELSIEQQAPRVDTEDFVVPESNATASNTTPAQPMPAGNQTIRIATDVLELVIDLTGGNIISAKMPQYKATLGSDQPLALLENSSTRYYVVKSGLFGKNGFDSAKSGSLPIYRAEQTDFTLAETADTLVVNLSYQDPSGVSLRKTYELKRNDYLIKVSYQINNQTSQVWEGNFSGKIERDHSADPSTQSSMGMQSFLGMVISSAEEPYEKIDFEHMLETPLTREIQGGWIAFVQHYFLSAWIPNAEQTHTYQSKAKDNRFVMGFVSPATTVEPGQSTTVSADLYLGPKIMDRLKAAAPKLDLTVDYGWLFFIASPLFMLLEFLHGIVQNWGIAIILVTVIVKALFFKLSASSYRSMANMRRVAPKLQALKDQFGDDRQKMSQAMMELYKKEKINPLGGCLPILVQMPVFISLYWVILESVQLRHAPFFFWIQDLSIKDGYFVLPILMGVSMFIQMQLNPQPPDPMQAKVMKIMPIMMTVFFLWFPAGLVLYWVVNNVLSIAQQWVITRQIERAGG